MNGKNAPAQLSLLLDAPSSRLHPQPPPPPPARAPTMSNPAPPTPRFRRSSPHPPAPETKLLTDRLLRLMLSGADPARIQCLTFTKAAAAEMALRLQRRLGEWVTLPDDALNAQLAELQLEPTPQRRDAARALFARVLDLPGGMRIGTIHAFCQSLLRRFPLEARSRRTSVWSRNSTRRWRCDAARETMLAGAHTPPSAPRWTTLAGLVIGGEFGEPSRTADRPRPAAPRWRSAATRLEAAQRRAVGAEADDATILARAVTLDRGALRDAAKLRPPKGSAWVRRAGAAAAGLAGVACRRPRGENWAQWCSEFLRPTAARRPKRLRQSETRQAQPELIEPCRRRAATHPGGGRRAARARAWPPSPPPWSRSPPRSCAAYAARQGRRRPARLRRPDRPHLRACWSIPAPPGCSTSSTVGSTICCSTRCRIPRPAQWRIAGALDRRSSSPASGARDARRTRVRRRRPQAVHLLLPGRRSRRVRALARHPARAASTAAGETLARCRTRRLIPLHGAGAGTGGRRVRRPACRRRRQRAGALRTLPTAPATPASVELWPLAPLPDDQPAGAVDRARDAISPRSARRNGWPTDSRTG